MSRVRRYDAGTLAAPEVLASGFLRVEGRISRTGIQEYVDASGKLHRELRLPEDVFAPESVKTFSLAPLTNDHPSIGLLDPTTARKYAVGSLGESLRVDGDFLAGPIIITDADAITAARTGRSQLSCGYTCELDATQDQELVAKYGQYDFIQRKIIGNHVALVDSARAGAGAALRLDAGAARAVVPGHEPVIEPDRPQGEPPMPVSIRIDKSQFDLVDANAGPIQGAIDRLIGEAQAKVDAANEAATYRVKALEESKRIVLDNAKRLLDSAKKAMARRDASKAKMSPCDECNGTGKVVAADGKEAACDYCDGKGSFRFHSKVADMVDSPDDPDDDGDVHEMDADELETEQETETEAGKAHKDRKRADAAAQRREDGARAKTEREASVQRRIDRAVKARADLEREARRHLGDAFDFTKLDNLGVKRAVIEKLAEGVKLDGKKAVEIEARYDAEIERVVKKDAGDGSTPADKARPLATGAAGGSGAPKADGSNLRGREKMVFEQEKLAGKIASV